MSQQYKRKYNFWVTLLIALIYTFLNPLNAKSELKLAASQDVPSTVIFINILKMAYQRLGIEIKIISYPSKRAVHESNAGSTDGVVSRAARIAQQYPNLIKVPVSIGTLRGGLFAKPSTQIKGSSDIHNYKLGLILGMKWAEDATSGMDREMAVSSQQLFKMLYHNRVDAVLNLRLAGEVTLKKLGYTNIHYLPFTLFDEPIFHFLHKKHKHLIPKITTELQTMKKLGLIKKITTDTRNELINSAKY